MVYLIYRLSIRSADACAGLLSDVGLSTLIIQIRGKKQLWDEIRLGSAGRRWRTDSN